MGISECINKCSKEEDNSQTPGNSYFIEETDSIVPQSIIDIKVNSGNFVIQRENAKVYDIYEKLQFLGEGSFGSVYKVKRKKSGTKEIIRALKEISKEKMCLNEESSEEIRNEISVLKSLDHPNIMKIYEFYEDNEKMYLITEFCGGDAGNLQDKYGVLPEFLVKYIMYQVFLAVAFFHANKIVHTDIKRENVSFFYKDNSKDQNYVDNFLRNLFQDKEVTEELMEAGGMENLSENSLKVVRELTNFDVKILDFGSAKRRNLSKLSGITGTVYYCSPEIVNNKYDFECDEWACGVMMYILLVGAPPFEGETEEDIFSKILKDEVDLNKKELNNISENCKDLIKGLLEKDAKKRIKAFQALKHPFFTSGISIGNLFKGKYKENNEILKNLYRSKTADIENKNKNSKFKEMVIAYISLNFSEEDEENKAKKIFMEMAGGDNHFLIRKKTFVQRMNNIYKGKYSSIDIEKLFDRLDENKSGNLEYEELIRALSDKKKLLSDKNLKEAFDFFDQNNNGSISWNEIVKIVYPNGEIDKSIMKEFMEEIGQKDENKEISFEEFKNILRK